MLALDYSDSIVTINSAWNQSASFRLKGQYRHDQQYMESEC